jgi:flagellar protein FliS
MLMEGFLTHVNMAKGAIEHGDIAQKSEQISRSILIVGGLQEALDGEKGGELAANLADLYRYLRDRLLLASRDNDPELLDEVAGLMLQIKSAWDAIPADMHYATRQ